MMLKSLSLIIATLFVVVVVVVAFCFAASVSSSSGSDISFDQYDSNSFSGDKSSICLYSNIPPLADWTSTSFSGTVTGITVLSSSSSTKSNNKKGKEEAKTSFAVLVNGNVFKASPPDSNDKKERANCSSHFELLASLSQLFRVAVPVSGHLDNCRLTSIPKSESLLSSSVENNNSTEAAVAACLFDEKESQDFEGCFAVFDSSATKTSGIQTQCVKRQEPKTPRKKLWSISVQPIILPSSSSSSSKQSFLSSLLRRQVDSPFPTSALLLGTSSGLYSWIPSQTSAAIASSSPIQLTNTTGGKALELNVTHIGCLPRNQISSKTFLGASCFASSQNHYCEKKGYKPKNGATECPADLIHIISQPHQHQRRRAQEEEKENHQQNPPTTALKMSFAQEETFIRSQGVIDSVPTATVFDPARKVFFFANDVCVNFLAANGSLTRVDGPRPNGPGSVGGLPQGLLTSAALNEQDGSVWFGSKQGVNLLFKPSAASSSSSSSWSWKYFYGPRWLPTVSEFPLLTQGNDVTAIASADRHTLIATSRGITFLLKRNWTLADKAASYAKRAVDKFDRYGTFINHQYAKIWGVTSSSPPYFSSNDGVWTSMTLAAFLFSSRQNSKNTSSITSNYYKELAWRAFEGMQLLLNVTKGFLPSDKQLFPARAAILGARPKKVEDWIKSRAPFALERNETWWFWPNASSDEVTGHFFAYSLSYDLLVFENEQQQQQQKDQKGTAKGRRSRERVVGLADGLMQRIVDGGLVLRGRNGEPCQWGFWDPKSLNDSPENYDERGLNSLEILSYLISSYRMTKNATFVAVFNDLVDNRHFNLNIRTTVKITQPDDVDHSDDLLTFLSFSTYYWTCFHNTENDKNLTEMCNKIQADCNVAFLRWWRVIKPERPSLYSPLAMWIMQKIQEQQKQIKSSTSSSSSSFDSEIQQAKQDLLFCLQTWPISIMRWQTDNSKRRDVIFSPYLDRDLKPHQKLRFPILPYDESSALLWNTDMNRAIQGSGIEVVNPLGEFNLPFAMSRYFGFL